VKAPNIIVGKSFNFSLQTIEYHKKLADAREYITSQKINPPVQTSTSNIQNSLL
jgi:hypothetical protein